MATSTFSQLSIAPLGAGDLIDRAVRLYRQHFFVLLRIASPPVVLTAVGTVFVNIGIRQVSATSDVASAALFILLLFGGVIVFLAGYIFSLIVMGGATRNLVSHLLWNEPVSARATYRAVKTRFWSLLGAAFFVLFFLIISSVAAGFLFYMVFLVVGLFAIALAQVAPVWFLATVGIVAVLVTFLLAFWLFFFLFGRVVYIPQAIMVEGKGVVEAISRSFSLAKGNVRRLMAMFVFTTFVFYSALAVLIVPLELYAWANGVDLSPFNQAEWPAWYSVGYGVIQESSHILLAPIWMLGLSLLYLDERVRREGYDIELLAARQLPEMPQLNVTSPLAPALALDPEQAPPTPMPSSSVLGLH